MRRRPAPRSARRCARAPWLEALEDRPLLSVTAGNFTVNALQNTPASVALKPFVDDTAGSARLSFSVGSPTPGGTISNVNASSGTFTYTPPSQTFLGDITVPYTATDTGTAQTGSGTVTIVVGRVAAERVGVPVLEGTSKIVNLGTDVADVASNATFTFNIPATSDGGGKITNVNASRGTFTYTPPSASYTGPDDLSYTVTDSQGNSSTGTVVFNVASLIANPDSAGVLQGTPLAIGLRSDVADVNPNPTLNFSFPARSAQGGTITNVDPSRGTLTYTPPSAGFIGEDSITYVVTDTTTNASATGIFVLNVAPLVAAPVSVGVLQGTTRTVNLGPAIQDASPTDSLYFSIPFNTARGGTVTGFNSQARTFAYSPPNATFTGIDSLTYTVTDETTGTSATGTVTFDVSTLVAAPATVGVLENTSKAVTLAGDIEDVNPTPTLSFAFPTNSGQGGTLSNVDPARGTFTYTPPSAAFTGTDAVQYTVTDTARGTSAVGLVVFDVASLVPTAIGVGVLEGASRSVALGPAIHDNDANPTLTFSLPAKSTQGGTLTNVDPGAGTFTYTPPYSSFTGNDALTYTVTDTRTGATATGVVSFSVTSLFAAPDVEAVLQGTTKTIGVGPFIEDVDPNPRLTFSFPSTTPQGGTLTNVGSANGTFTYTPPSPSFTGTDTISYTVTDTNTGTTASGVVTLNVATLVANRVSVGVLQGSTRAVSLASAVADVAANPVLQFSIPATTDKGGTISAIDAAKGTFTYAPPSPTFDGTDALTYTVTDTATGTMASGVVEFDVSALLTTPLDVGVLTGQTRAIDVSSTVHDVSSNPQLVYTFPSASARGGALTGGNSLQGSFTYAPPSTTFTGVDTVSYTVTDEQTRTTANGVVVINVASLVADNVTANVLEGTTHAVDLGPAVHDLTASPTLSFSIPAQTRAGGTVTAVDTANGTFTYSPPSAAFAGTDTLTYTVTDQTSHVSSSATVVFDVTGLVANKVDASVAPGTSKAISLAPAVQDIHASDTLQFAIPASSRQGGQISGINASAGTFTYTPPSPGFVGTDSLVFTVTDTVTQAVATSVVAFDVHTPPLTIVSTNPANGSVVTALPGGKIVVTFNEPLATNRLYFANGRATGLLASDPYSIFLIARGPSGAFSAPLAGQYEGGDLPLHANTTYQVNANGTSQITITPASSLAADVYAIAISGAYTNQAGDTLAAGIGTSTYYATFLYQPPPVTNNPLEVTGVTSYNGFTTINNNAIFQPDTIGIHFNKPLFAGAANNDTVQLFAEHGSSATVQPSVAAYSPTTDTIYLTPTGVLSPGTVYLIRVAGQNSRGAYVSDDQGYGHPGFPLATTFYDTFTILNSPAGAGHAPLEVAAVNGTPATLPASGVLWTVPVGYASIGFTQPVALSAFGHYSAMLVPASGGLNPAGLDAADVPLNATLAFNPNTNQLIFVPSQPVGNDLYLYSLSNIDAATPNGQPIASDPLLNNAGQPAGVNGAPAFFETFALSTASPRAAPRVLVARQMLNSPLPHEAFRLLSRGGARSHASSIAAGKGRNAIAWDSAPGRRPF